MLNELGNIGDFIGGLAVVATLVYLALQIRHNTATTRVQTVQHLLTSDTAAVIVRTSCPEGARRNPRKHYAFNPPPSALPC